ncbi:hypothetical protein K525DRAFT_208192 [Schizophyllum commune Loenen D]|nr:hypothetical protein K525DRAFT_208192 [Schizophyllum commune Loenen D]
MAPRKPRWDWKAKGAAELDLFDIPFAAKEYLQNQVGQLLKERNIYAWNYWTHNDFRESTQKEREACKKQLIQEYPGLLTGPHGASLRKSAWQPIYVLSATVERNQLVRTHYSDALKICTVVWNGKNNKDDETILMGLSFYNNHLDRGAHFGTFVTDGASTSRRTIAVGEKGKGFILATQYLHEEIERHCKDLDPKLKTGVSFRVGSEVGELTWKKERVIYYDEYGRPEPPLLQVVKDDLQPWTADSLANSWAQMAHDARKAAANSDESDYYSEGHHEGMANWLISSKQRTAAEKAIKAIYKRRFTQNLSTKKTNLAGEATGPHDEVANVRPDEVCITVLGLPSHPPEDVFSAIYGVVPPPNEWKASDAVTFFKAPGGKSLFYHRDQLVPYPPSLNKLSVNYHGHLSITADRAAIIQEGIHFDVYRQKVADAANDAFGTDPELAKEIILDVLQDDKPDGGATVGRVLSSALQRGKCSKTNGDAVRDAFNAAAHEQHPDIPENVDLYPHCKNRKDERALIQELGLHPVVVSALTDGILKNSGAYTPVHAHATRLLLAASTLTHHVPGFNHLRRAIKHVFADLDDAQITVRDYPYSTPRAVWDGDNKVFAFALPPACSAHQDSKCVCFVGPYLSAATSSRRSNDKRMARKEKESNSDDESDEEDDEDETAGVFQAFMHAFNVPSTDIDHPEPDPTVAALDALNGAPQAEPPKTNDTVPSTPNRPRQTARRGRTSFTGSGGHTYRRGSPAPSYGGGFGYAGGLDDDDNDDDMYARTPTPEPEAGPSNAARGKPAQTSASTSGQDVEMADATDSTSSADPAQRSTAASSKAVTPTPPAQTAPPEALAQPVASEPSTSVPGPSNTTTLTLRDGPESEMTLDDYLAGVHRIVNQQKETVATAVRKAEEPLRKELDAKAARVRELEAQLEALQAQVTSTRAEGEAKVQSLNAVVEDLQSQLQLIHDIIRPKETGSKRPRTD